MDAFSSKSPGGENAQQKNSQMNLAVNPYLDYALHIAPGMVSAWPMYGTGLTPLADFKIDRFKLDTRIKLTGPVAMGSYAIGQLMYQGDETVYTATEPLFTTDVNSPALTVSSEDVACMEEMFANMENGLEVSRGFFDTHDPCKTAVLNVSYAGALTANSNGYLEYDFENTAVKKNTEVGFKINAIDYGFKFNMTTSKLVVAYSNTTTEMTGLSLTGLKKLRVERQGNIIDFYCAGTKIHTVTVSGSGAYAVMYQMCWQALI